MNRFFNKRWIDKYEQVELGLGWLLCSMGCQSCMGQIDQFKIIPIWWDCAKSFKKQHKKCKYELTMNTIL